MARSVHPNPCRRRGVAVLETASTVMVQAVRSIAESQSPFHTKASSLWIQAGTNDSPRLPDRLERRLGLFVLSSVIVDS